MALEGDEVLKRALLFALASMVTVGCAPSFHVETKGAGSTDHAAGGSEPAPVTGKACVADEPGEALVRRLSTAEIKNSVRDILGVSFDSGETLPRDTASTDHFTNNAGLLAANSAFTEKYLNAVEKAVTDAIAANSALVTCPTGTDGASCVKSLVGKLARRVFRRTVKAEELNEVGTGATQLLGAGYSVKETLAAEYQKLFLSPRFLFRSAAGQAGEGVKNLTQFELASRLSYFLWVGPPDEALLAKAESGKLSDEATLKSEVVRMLKDAKAERFAKLFIGEWTEIGNLGRADIAPELRADVIREAELLLWNIIQQDLSAMELITSNSSFLNERLAQHYGISGVTGTNFRKVSLAETPRRGLLTSGAFTMLTASSGASKPTGRGNRILTNIICSPPPPFPDGIDITPLEPATGPQTIRQRMEIHRSSASCIGCHSEMDPVGFALESFDQFGRFRTKYADGLEVDPSGAFRGRNFANHNDLLKFIAEENAYKACISRKLLTFAVGRAFESRGSDQCTAETIGKAHVQPTSKFSDMILAIVSSQAFTKNRTDSKGEL